jgi:hypothetical protein
MIQSDGATLDWRPESADWITDWIMPMIQWFTALESQKRPDWIISQTMTRTTAAAHWIMPMIQSGECGPVRACAGLPRPPMIQSAALALLRPPASLTLAA